MSPDVIIKSLKFVIQLWDLPRLLQGPLWQRALWNQTEVITICLVSFLGLMRNSSWSRDLGQPWLALWTRGCWTESCGWSTEWSQHKTRHPQSRGEPEQWMLLKAGFKWVHQPLPYFIKDPSWTPYGCGHHRKFPGKARCYYSLTECGGSGLFQT